MLITQPQPKDITPYYESEAYISHTDSSKSIMDKLYQFVKTISLKKKVSLINKLTNRPGSLLDVGAGTGDFLKSAEQKKWRVEGVEPNPKARKLASLKKLKLCSDIEECTDQKFDVISLWHVLEHLPNTQDYLAKLKTLLKNNGHLIIAVPNYKSFDATYYKEYWAAFDVPRHLYHFSQYSIKKLAEENKLEFVKVLPMKFDAYYVSLLSEKYKGNKTNWFKALYSGLRSNLKAKSSGEYSSLIYVLKNTK
jgi:2-polyprenyl-3-methyl-5-hydroxy-6-metoxy-1,4-benzoquinol methylase